MKKILYFKHIFKSTIKMLLRLMLLFSIKHHKEMVYYSNINNNYRLKNIPQKSHVKRYLDLLFISIVWENAGILYYLQNADLVNRKVTRDYLPYTEFKRIRDSKNRTKPYDYICLLQDKLLFERYYNSVGLKVTKSLKEILPCSETDIFISDIKNSLIKHGRDGNFIFFLKPRYGIKGKNSFKLEIKNNDFIINDKIVDKCQLLDLIKENYICQHIVEQHHYIKALHPESLNTLRVITYRDNHKKIKVFLAYLRIGSMGCITDNNSRSRVIVEMDTKTGKLHEVGVSIENDNLNESYFHNTTMNYFSKITVPYYYEALQIAIKAHKFTPGIHSIGWDIAIKSDGVELIEGNDDWGGTSPMGIMNDFKSKYLTMHNE